MKDKLLKSSLLFLLIILYSGCFFSASRDKFVYERLSKGIVDGTIHNGITSNEVIDNIGKPSEKTSPVVIDSAKTQTFIYKQHKKRRGKMYYLYFKDDELIDWEIF